MCVTNLVVNYELLNNCILSKSYSFSLQLYKKYQQKPSVNTIMIIEKYLETDPRQN